jgi:ADP-heptose:LPS heptosyltransferase
VLTTPVIRCVKQQVPNAEVHFATKEIFQDIVAYNPYLTKVHLLGKDTQAHIKSLKEEKFDIILDLHNNLRTKRIIWALGIKAFSYDKLNIQKYLLVNFKWNQLPDIHIVDRYLATAKTLGVKNDSLGLDYFYPSNFDNTKVLELVSNKAPYTALVIGANHTTKKLPLVKLVELLNNLKGNVVLLGGKAEVEEAQELLKQSDFVHLDIVSTVGLFTLHESAYALQLAEKVITHDTGLMHIAAALKKPIISIWGNTVPELGMYPYLSSHINLEVKGLNCRPCSKIGFKACPKGHFKCMMLQNFEGIDTLKP